MDLKIVQNFQSIFFCLIASNWPFFFKLTFSATPITDDDAQLGEEMDTTLATITLGSGGGGSGRRHHGQKSPNDDNRNESANDHRRRRHSSPST
jgi:hypothetical protein